MSSSPALGAGRQPAWTRQEVPLVRRTPEKPPSVWEPAVAVTMALKASR